MKAIMPVRITCWVSIPAPCMPTTSSNLKPLRRCIISTRRVTSFGCGRGTMYPVWPNSCNILATSNMLSASIRKSSSSTMVSANNSTSAGGFASALTLMRPTRCGASHAITRKSWRTILETEGRCTLTTTFSPVINVATCTCAMDAAASGVVSMYENTSVSRAPKSLSITCFTSLKGIGGTWSRHSLNSFTNSAGNKPSPLLMICPSLM